MNGNNTHILTCLCWLAMEDQEINVDACTVLIFMIQEMPGLLPERIPQPF